MADGLTENRPEFLVVFSPAGPGCWQVALLKPGSGGSAPGRRFCRLRHRQRRA
jgi:hypothetical protein